jgi:predicted nucleic acid-binding protein
MEKVMAPTRTQVFTKRTLQQVLKDLRAHDYHVLKEEGGYRVYIDDTESTLVLRALNGQNSYLVTYTEELLQAA